jgi:hypothetical protein
MPAARATPVPSPALTGGVDANALRAGASSARHETSRGRLAHDHPTALIDRARAWTT